MVIAWSANNWGEISEPWDRWRPDSVTIPQAWIDTANHDWDYAVVEWAPSNAPGDQVGWLGTEFDPIGFRYIIGYPIDKPDESQWIKSDYYGAAIGVRIRHAIDTVGGDSGACAYRSGGVCNGIHVIEVDSSDGARWNEVRRWDSTTYNFFHAYGNWP